MIARRPLPMPLLLGLAGVAVSGAICWWHFAPAQAPPQREPTIERRGRYQGVASCATAGCHHNNGPAGSPRSEYSTWIQHDPHADAYAVLLDPPSRMISRNLRRGKPAHEDSLCLNCHVHPDFEQSQRAPRFSAGDGVGCESCHGPAENWLREHSMESWKSLSPLEKSKKGLADTRTLSGRAQTCVGCHVGTPGSEVNHDLLAAGHPRLAFEFSGYHAALPRHWDGRKDRARHADWEVRAWQVGQIVSAEAALRLLEHRAAESEIQPVRQPWPEFAEYDCASCHHDLKAKSWRQERGFGTRRPGNLAASAWYTALLSLALESPLADLESLRREMEKPRPRGTAVAEHARRTLLQLEEKRKTIKQVPSLTAGDLLDRFTRLRTSGPRATWEEAGQTYQALSALYQAWPHVAKDRLPSAWRRELQELALRLESSAKFTTPVKTSIK